jgi:hypothetical protein
LETEWPDIVLVDVGVPEVSGYEVAARVKQTPRLRRVPVLMFAGAFEPIDQDRVRSIGCEGVLVKPFEPQQLVSRVKELLTEAPNSSSGAGKAGVTPFPAPVTRGSEMMDDFRGAQTASFDSVGVVPEPLEPPDRNVWEHRDSTVQTGPSASSRQPDGAPAAPAPKVSLVNAFSALLAAEQSSQPAPVPQVSAPVLTDATVEDAVRRVLARMTDDLVRRIVVETAERLIKEEIEKIKEIPE